MEKIWIAQLITQVIIKYLMHGSILLFFNPLIMFFFDSCAEFWSFIGIDYSKMAENYKLKFLKDNI